MALLAAEAEGSEGGGGRRGGKKGDGEAAPAVQRVVKCYGFMWTFRY